MSGAGEGGGGVDRRAMDRRGICEQQRGIGDTMREASAGSREASALDWQGIGGLSGKAPARDRRAAAMGLGESEEADPAAGD